MRSFQKFRAVLSRITQMRANEKISDRELADLGLSRSDFKLLISGGSQVRDRIEAMATEFGITQDALQSHPQMGLELAENCGHCREKKTCQRVLKSGGKLPVSTCPNAELYQALISK